MELFIVIILNGIIFSSRYIACFIAYDPQYMVLNEFHLILLGLGCFVSSICLFGITKLIEYIQIKKYIIFVVKCSLDFVPKKKRKCYLDEFIRKLSIALLV